MVIRLAYKPVLAFLLTFAVAAGGCLPCQQLLGERAAKSCCNSKGECQRPTPKKACNLQLLQTQMEVKRYVGLPGASAIAYGEFLVEPARIYLAFEPIEIATHSPSPPSLFLLHSSLLI